MGGGWGGGITHTSSTYSSKPYFCQIATEEGDPAKAYPEKGHKRPEFLKGNEAKHLRENKHPPL